MASGATTSSADNPDDIETVETGLFVWRARRGAPLQPVEVRYDGVWRVLIAGVEVRDSGKPLAKDIPFLLWHAPFHPIGREEFDAMMREHKSAPKGHPLSRPGDRVDFRASPPLYQGRKP